MKTQPFRSVLPGIVFLSAILSLQSTAQAKAISQGRILDGKLHHLGDVAAAPGPKAPLKPEGAWLVVKFTVLKYKTEKTLSVTYWDINDPAAVEINGHKLEALPPSQARQTVYVRIPAGTLRQGENQLSIIPKAKDDCMIGKLVLHEQPFRELMELQTLHVSVRDSETGKAIPARVTITTTNGEFSEIFLAPTNGTAIRPGLIYISGEETEIALRKGDYTIYASRGMEWSRDKRTISLKVGAQNRAALQLRHEVKTDGFIACDSHIHTLTFSGHGDATMDERMVTLAGEGVELAVATDHNHHTDYLPHQKKLGLNSYFTSVVGNEVTTAFGHMNAFPMSPDGPIPNHKETNWVTLVEDIRLRGAKVVILNHPRWKKYDVFEDLGFSTLTGEQRVYERLPFDGLELANSCSLRVDPMQLFGDLFALLNHGENIKAVGSSDSHTVRQPVGQGRTYIRSSTDNPAMINVGEACTNFLAGKSSISLGMFADVVVEDNFRAGAIVPLKNSQVRIKFRVAAPTWVWPTRAFIFLNGVMVAERALTPPLDKPMDEQLEFTIPSPSQDAHLVCVALGDGVNEPFWKTEQNYTLAATNPVFLDADNDGVYRSPRETAKRILTQAGDNLDARWKALGETDDSVAAQLFSLIYKEADASARNELRARLLKNATSRPVFARFLSVTNAVKN